MLRIVRVTALGASVLAMLEGAAIAQPTATPAAGTTPSAAAPAAGTPAAAALSAATPTAGTPAAGTPSAGTGPTAAPAAAGDKGAAPADDKAAADKAAADKAAADKVAAEEPWYKKVTVGAFVDAYGTLNYNLPKVQQDANTYHPYNPHQGFGVSWVGVDAAYDDGTIGAVVQVRVGPAVKNLALNDFTAPGGIGNLQNAYLTWKPTGKDGKVTLMAGKFDTLYGAEVAPSHLNMNYTRGALYNLAQPFFHTGLRLDAVFDKVTAKFMVVNGWNNTIDNNTMKSFGAQLVFNPSDKFAASLGYLGGPEQAEAASTVVAGQPVTVENVGANSRWRHLFDLVLDAKPSDSFRFLFNGTFVTDVVPDAQGQDQRVSWWGVSAMARYGIGDDYGIAGRVEFIRDKDGQITAPNTKDMSLITSTLTLEAKPSKMLVLRLDNRLDHTTEDVFANKSGIGANKNQFTTTLGMVVRTP